jgi:putative glutamine amidotransferase
MGMPAQPQEKQRRCASSMPVERPLIAVMQVLNVARGGALDQHLPDIVGDGIAQRQQEPGRPTTYWVMLEPSSKVCQIVKRSRTKVNSFHHQAVARLGGGLTATAWARRS